MDSVTKINKYTILENGFLQIHARVVKECVAVFDSGEFGNPEPVAVFYPLKEIAGQKQLEDLAKAPVIVGHKSITVDNSNEVVGHVLGIPQMSGGYVECELLITHKETIDKIINKELNELSVSFVGNFVEESGIYEGEAYGGRFSAIIYQHIALLPSGVGRLGNDIRVFNSKKKVEEKEMNTINNSTQETAQKEMITVEELAKLNEQLQKITEEIEKLKGEKAQTAEELEKEKEENKKKEAELQALKEQNEKLAQECTEEAIAAKAEEIKEDQNAAAEICETLDVKVNNSGLSGTRLHRATLAAFESFGFDSSNLSDDAAKACFSLLKAVSEVRKAAAPSTVKTIVNNSKAKASNCDFNAIFKMSEDEKYNYFFKEKKAEK